MVDWEVMAALGGDLLWQDVDAVDVARVIRDGGGYGYMASAYTKRFDKLGGKPLLGHDLPVRDAFMWRAWFAADHAPLYSPLETGHALATMKNERPSFTGLDGRLQGLSGGYQDFHFDAVDAATWDILDDPFVLAAECVVVPPIHGRDHSVGTEREIRTALKAQIPVYVLADMSR